MLNLPMVLAVTVVKTLELTCIFFLIQMVLKKNRTWKRIAVVLLMLVPCFVAFEYTSRCYYTYRTPLYIALATLGTMLLCKLCLDIKIKHTFIITQLFYIMVCGGKIISNLILTHSFGSKIPVMEATPFHYLLQYMITYAVVGVIILIAWYSKLFLNFPKSIRYNVLFSGGGFITLTILIAWVNAFYYDRIVAFGFGRLVIMLDVMLFLYLIYNLIVTNKNLLTQKRLIDTLNEKNAMLETVNRQLKEYAVMVEELTAERERNRIARDTHDTLGRTMILLITILEKCKLKYTHNFDIKDDLCETIDIARGGMDELKRSISGLAPREVESENLISSLKELMAQFEAGGLNIHFTAEEAFHCDNRNAEVLFRACQEALTNALRHGKAKNTQVILASLPFGISLSIIDDGIGCDDFKKGFGLSGIEQKVKELGGNISFHAAGERGFIVDVALPADHGNLKSNTSRNMTISV